MWRWWKYLVGRDRVAGLVITAGFLVRAFAAQALFWISYLRLPFARSLQAGDGFWNLAIDARMYFNVSAAILDHGCRALVLIDRSLPSPAFLQILAVFMILFGYASSTGALLNLFVYLGVAAVIIRCGRREDGTLTRPSLYALAAISFAPGVIIWSVQPLKDPFFLLLVAAFVLGGTLWQRAFTREDRIARHAMLAALLMIFVLFEVAGVRWYFGVILWLASLPFLIGTALLSRRRAASFASGLLLFLLLAQAVILGAYRYLPPPVMKALHPFDKRATTIAEMPQAVARTADFVRSGFNRSGGASRIEVGDAFKTDPTPAPVTTTTTTPTPTATATTTTTTTTTTTPDPTTATVATPTTTSAAPVVPPTTTAVAVIPPKPLPAPRPAMVEEGPSADNTTRSKRLATGFAALFLPRFIAQPLGLLHVGGGQGLWAIVELDTILFDVVLVLAIYFAFRGSLASALRNPSFWLITISTGALAFMLAYAVTNFGTLFRHRAMILLGLCMLLAIPRGAAAMAARGTTASAVPTDTR